MTSEFERAKVSVSMTDDLKQRTEAYAQQHTLNFSEVVQQALEQFLVADSTPVPAPHPPAPQPAPVPSPPAPASEAPAPPFDLATLRDFVLQIAVQHEYLREGLQRAGLASCYPLPRPPWLATRKPIAAWPPLRSDDQSNNLSGP